MTTRILYLDDSGKPESQHASRAVVLGGFAIDAEEYATLARRILGAKGRFYPGRGVPQKWEIKSADIIKPNPWRRRKNRDFCAEVVRLLRVCGSTTYTTTIDKGRLNHPMRLSTSMPLQLQILAEHFGAECEMLGCTGMIIADWSGHQHDQHASECVASFVASCRLPLHPTVYYGSSHSTQAIQVADLLAGIRRRHAEGAYVWRPSTQNWRRFGRRASSAQPASSVRGRTTSPPSERTSRGCGIVAVSRVRLVGACAECNRSTRGHGASDRTRSLLFGSTSCASPPSRICFGLAGSPARSRASPETVTRRPHPPGSGRSARARPVVAAGRCAGAGSALCRRSGLR